ncbi:MAG TPA: YicC family protein [Melioribacteraceae bacterium]|nr:YicC family protein [Melioribacteraceae bacterium]
MISSMTGYGKGYVEENDLSAEAEIKSLNNRYLDLSLRLPKFLAAKEFEIREKVKTRIKRGKIYLAVTVRRGEFEEKFNEVDPASVKLAMKVLKDIRKASGLKNKISFSDLMVFQNLFFKEDEEQAGAEMPLVEKAIDIAIDDMNRMREAEGRELEKDVRKRIKHIEEVVTKIERIKQESLENYFARFKEKANQLVSDLIDNEQRLITELAILSERYDVTEECVRLRSHLKMFIDTLDKSDDAGRRLNFILQEMNREANTINSKALASDISHSGIYIKEEIEKIREQIQNIE